MELTRLFVYGTLKRGYCRSHHLAGQRFVGEARTRPGYRMFNVGEYPGLVVDPAGIAIEGELWEVDDACLARLDEVEWVFANVYQRQSIPLSPPFDDRPAQTYIYQQDTAGMAECGPRWE